MLKTDFDRNIAKVEATKVDSHSANMANQAIVEEGPDIKEVSFQFSEGNMEHQKYLGTPFTFTFTFISL